MSQEKRVAGHRIEVEDLPDGAGPSDDLGRNLFSNPLFENSEIFLKVTNLKTLDANASADANANLSPDARTDINVMQKEAASKLKKR